MKSLIFYIFVLIFIKAGFCQTVFENFDFYNIQTKYLINTPQVTPNSKITLSRQSVDNYEEDNALSIEYSIPATLDWGGNAVVQFINPDTVSGVWDFSDYYSLSFAINNKIPSSQPSLVDLRIILNDISDAPTATKYMLESEFWVSFLYVLELEPGWNTFDIPFIAVSRSVAEEKPSSGFWHSDEIGVLGNDKLDLDRIAGITLEFHMSAPQDDSTIAEGTVLLDDLVLESNTTGINDNVINPRSFSLEQNYPNPFNPSTHIQFNISSQVNVRLNVYDILGREVATLVDKEMMPGKHNLVFDAGDLPSGIYFYKIQAGKYSQTNKMILLK